MVVVGGGGNSSNTTNGSNSSNNSNWSGVGKFVTYVDSYYSVTNML